MSKENSLLYQIALTMVPNIGSALAQQLIAYCGSAEAVFKTSKSKLLKVPQIGEERAKMVATADVMAQAEKELKFMEEYKIKPLFYTDAEYPQRLRECNDMPLLLYYRGSTDLNAPKIVAVVGTRKITPYGKAITQKIIQELATQNIVVVSGLAYGVDVAAHQAALDCSLKTIGVMAHGLNQIYPIQHTAIAKKMVEQGGLLTEYHSQKEMHPSYFPERNRIVAGMSDAIVVVESDVKGGAVITANIANTYNKDVFAVPGRVGDKYSSGCNFLIKTYKASIIETGTNLIEAMNWQDNTAPKKKRQLNLSLSAEEQKVYQLLQEVNEMEIDMLVHKSGMSSGELATTLLEMEMTGAIVSLPGKRYRLVA